MAKVALSPACAISGEQQLEIVKILFIEEVYYYFVHWVVKFAFLVFYLRLSPDKTFRKLVYFGMGTNIAIFIANMYVSTLFKNLSPLTRAG
ncbi:hypothetical protein N0V95_004631 [Ascochyta clinopodiicola]|nr:hypothetical protein N0V95_004631 [Ascochyta clinopodiicola]